METWYKSKISIDQISGQAVSYPVTGRILNSTSCRIPAWRIYKEGYPAYDRINDIIRVPAGYQIQ